ncbi:MAG: HupE/UreJ family protein [Verrucomicrobiales bacterium]|nr:HupE/UreJ family protein [Verrucomicrobiales bacterium]
MPIHPVFPEHFKVLSPPRVEALEDSELWTWSFEPPVGGLDGAEFGAHGLDVATMDVLVHVVTADGRVVTRLLTPAVSSLTLTADQRVQLGGYLRLGIAHILLGVDHLLFVLGLLLIVPDRWMLLKTVTAFTVAHSLTLAVATLGYAEAPLEPLNVTIALSILFLGPEIVRFRRGETSLTIRHPWVVAFAFGLLHGFGFASGLRTLGLPAGEIPLALLLFNVGVEIGQVGFVLLVLGLVTSFRVLEVRWSRPARALPGFAVGSLGAFWFVQRLVIMASGWR